MVREKQTQNKILLVRDGIYEIINLDDVFFIESSGRDVIFHTTRGDFACSETLQSLENKLRHLNFYRVHRSYLANTKKIKKVRLVGDRTRIIEFYNSSKTAFISRSRFKEFISVLEDEYLTIKKI